jgi:hypothetical protein
LNNNQLSGSIPVSIANKDWDSLDLSYNHFTFDGMELVAQQNPVAQYDHQAQIPVLHYNSALSVSAGGTPSNNTYTWYSVSKNEYKRVAIRHGDSVFHPSENGIYVARIVNSVATQLVLYSDTVQFKTSALENSIIAANTSISDATGKTNDFVIYPNPAKNILHVETNGSGIFSLTDQLGKIALTQNINNKGSLDISHLSAGIYYLKNNNTGIAKAVIITK